MSLVDTKADGQYFVFEHSHQYRKIQNTFWEAVDSMNPQNIAVNKVISYSVVRRKLCRKNIFTPIKNRKINKKLCCQKLTLSGINSVLYQNHLFTSYLQQVLNLQPYHIDSLLQLSDVCRMSDDTAMATDLLGKNVRYCRTY